MELSTKTPILCRGCYAIPKDRATGPPRGPGIDPKLSWTICPDSRICSQFDSPPPFPRDIPSMSSTDDLVIPPQPWLLHDWVFHSQILLDSYRHWVGTDLLPRAGSAEDQAEALFEAPFVVVSHGVEADPILNYGNRTALGLWHITIDQLRQTPSRLTAEPLHREERARLLERTSRQGFVDDYQGIRIATTGQRFLIRQATVWNLRTSQGGRVGQAATFSHWEWL